MNEHEELILKGARLCALGQRLEAARDRMDALYDEGVSLTSPCMQAAGEEFNHLCFIWQRLQKEYLELFREIS